MERAAVNSLLFCGMVLLIQLPAHATQSVTLAWNASTDPTVVGYNIYYGGASGDYTNTLSAGNATNLTVSGLVAGDTYYFAATSYNSSGVQSPFSSEVSYSVPTNTVTVNQPPTLNPINNLTINENAGLQTVNLSGITSGATNQYQTLTVTATSGNTNLIPNPTVHYTSANTSGSLTFTPVANANGSAIITVTVNNGGASNNIVTQTFTVTVNPVNQPPTLNPINNVSINENAGLQTVNLSGITSGAANQNQFLTVSATSGNINLVPNPTVIYTSANTTGSLTFTPVANANGSAIVTVTVNNGGASNNIVTRTFTVTVNPVNQPPTLNPINNLTLNENAGLQTMNLSGITSGAANQNQTLTVSATSGNISLIPNPTVHYTSANTNGSLTFTPVANATGSAIVTVTVNNGGASNNIVTRTFTVTVNPVNQPPTLNPINNLTINENAGLQTVNLSGITSGATNQYQTLTVTATSGNTNLIPNPTVHYTSANTSGSLTFTPVANANGSAIITVTVNNGGASNNIVTQTFTVTVNPVNQPPTLNPINNVSINENAGLQTVNLSGITSGAANQNQFLTVSATSGNINLIPNPTVNYTSANTNGSLTFTPVANANGSTIITVTVNNGGASNNIVTRTFTVTVNPVNQPPTLNPINNLTINENAGLQTVNLSGITSGAANQKQTLTVSATSGNINLVPNPTVHYTSANTNGSLTFTPVTDANGSTIITVTVNNGGASNNIVTQTFTVTVNPVNQPPTLNPINNLTLNENAGPQTVNLSGITSGAANQNQFLTVSATSGNINLIPNPTVNYTSANTNGSLTFTPVTNVIGSAIITVSVNNGGASNNIVTQTFTVNVQFSNDHTPPTDQITAPTANQQWTNGGFTVTGKAGDNVAVGTVYYSLNGSGWTSATTANNWTNWTANVALTPGTNTVQAYAVDTSGNISTTNTVKFEYVVLKPLTVQIIGLGSVNPRCGTLNPNYTNGTPLAINENYTLTANPSSGFAFTNWTGSLRTNGATLRFMMQTNLTLQANFVDITKPTLSIVTPTANQQWTNGTFTVTGKANDNVAVGAVYYSLNGSGWTAATTANNWTNWTANLTLTPGTNTVQAYAVDTSGNISPTNTVRFEYVVLKPLTVQIIGLGTVNPKWGTLNPNYTNGTPLAINENYWMTAIPASGFAFTNWTDGFGNLLTNRATLQFTMVTNLALQAHFVDITKPTVSIITPTSNQQWTNGTFTVTGKAGDNVAVGAVYYSLNGSGWTSATTGNGWTNWTANLTLTPGTNTVQAYAVDTSGNISPTNTVRFEYVVRKPLTVQIIGLGTVNPKWGTLNPNYTNGTPLAINENYWMTANPASGFAFTNWTDGFGNLLTNRATLQFTMVTNLALQAHFVDITKPTVSIITPTSNQQWTNGTFTVTGKAGDNVAVGAVYYSLNGSGWTSATTGNGWTNWTANLTLTPGTNTVQAYAVDTSGNISTTNTVRFEYVVRKPLTVQIIGLGTVNPKWGTLNPNYTNGTPLAINENYTLTANPASGFAFTNWTDGFGNLLTNRATLQFTMVTNLALQAHFVDITKPTLSIVTPTANQQWTNGTFTVTGKAGDNVAVGEVYYSLNGSGWTAATTGNGWTNWTANLTLTPGTNTVQAYAVDTSGNISPTNTVRFEYVVLKPLTVQIIGLGTVNPKWGALNPNYTNGTPLAINENYWMTAIPASGFAFTNWTDGFGNLLTNRATLQFTMVTNLALQAHFVDITKPTVSIITPTSNQQWTNETFTVTGKAGDNVAVGAVYYSLNGSGWTSATTGNGWTNWTANLTLTPGTNTVQACAVDTSGNISITNKVIFAYATAPNSLAGLMGAVNESGGGTFYLCFGTSTFSQNSGNTNYDNGVGNYTYTHLSPKTAQLSITYTAPPSISGAKTVVLLTFITNNECLFSNQSNVVNTGTIDFWAVPTWAPTSLNGKTSALIADGQMTTAAFGSSTLTITNASGQATNGNYTFKQYSPLGALLTVTQPHETNFMQLTFAATNYGTYDATAYAGSSNAPTTDTGVFALVSESPGGNAPDSLEGTAAQVTQADGAFEMNFGPATFAQSSLATNYANGVGTYTYSRLSADSAELSISYTAPPTVAETAGAGGSDIYRAEFLRVNQSGQQWQQHPCGDRLLGAADKLGSSLADRADHLHNKCKWSC